MSPRATVRGRTKLSVVVDNIVGMKRSGPARIGLVLAPLLFNAWLFLGQPTTAMFGLWYLVPVVAVVLLFWPLQRWPFVVLVLLTLNEVGFEFAAPGWRGSGFHVAISTIFAALVDVVVGYIAAARHRRVSVSAAVAVAIVQSLLAFAGGAEPNGITARVLPDLIALLAAWLIGNTVRQRRLFTEARLADAARTAVQTERLRIARELHDMVAHSIGVIAMQAGMGRRVIDSQPEEARSALGVIEDTSRETLGALRRMLGSLRRTEAYLDEEPAPGLADLERLAVSSRAAGLRVDIRACGQWQPLPPDVDLSAYRIIQEAVTNVARHSGTEHCEVVVEQYLDRLLIDVFDDGRGGEPGLGGYGIAGMRERVSLLGGEFSAGPRPEGGFRVTAQIPIPAGT
jgi:signal transduction histidine kinase